MLFFGLKCKDSFIVNFEFNLSLEYQVIVLLIF